MHWNPNVIPSGTGRIYDGDHEIGAIIKNPTGETGIPLKLFDLWYPFSGRSGLGLISCSRELKLMLTFATFPAQNCLIETH